MNSLLTKARQHPGSLSFREACRLAEMFGFSLARIKGSHHMYQQDAIAELVNLQPAKDGKSAKTYQVRDIVKLIDQYNLIDKDER